MTDKDSIPITETPFVSGLAKDYLLGKDIGITNPLITDYDGLVEKAKSKKFDNGKRIILADALLEQYKRSGIRLDENSKVYQNILSLKDSKTFSFTTGQQIHIFLGPLFFIYKIQSLLRHVRNFNKLNNGYNAVPVFWMASEDHDLEEINHIKLYNETFKWEPEAGNAVGRINCKGLPELIEEIETRADKTTENKELFSLFRRHYTNDKSLAEATQSLLHEIFEEEGLIILNPDDKTLKQEFLEIAKKEIEKDILYNHYNAQIGLLKSQGYEARVKAQKINYFWLENNKRIKLLIKDSAIVKGDSNEEIDIKTILENIENLSPNVITRPIYQETILPNILYIGGSAELEYWLPLQTAFTNLGLLFPALNQRDSMINISKKNFEAIEKAGLDWHQLFNSEKEIVDLYFKLTNQKSFVLTEKSETILNDLHKLESDIESNDIKTASVFKEVNEIKKGITRLSKMIVEEELKRQKNDPVLNRILKIKEKIFDKKQEREDFFTGNPFILKYAKFVHFESRPLLIVSHF